MESLKNLETMVASWYKSAPHLPSDGQKWLAENVWWLALIGLVLGAFGILSILTGVLLAGTILAGVGGPLGAAIGSIAFFSVLVTLAFSIADMVIIAVAISPLKAKQKRGWSLLFLVALINVLSLAVSFLFKPDIFGLVWELLFVAVGGYFLFEVRGQFGAHNTKAAKAKK